MVDEAKNGAEEKEEAPKAEKSAKKKGGGLVKMIVIVVILVAALGGGYFVGQMLFFPAPTEENGDGNGSNGEPGGSPDDSREVVLFDPENPPGVLEFNQPFLIKMRSTRGILSGNVYLKLNLTLEVADAQTATDMAGSPVVMSRISDTVNTYVMGKYPEEVQAPAWPKLKDDLKRMINKQFPEIYHILRVNFREFVMQSR